MIMEKKRLVFYVSEFYAAKAFDVFQSQGFIRVSYKLWL